MNDTKTAQLNAMSMPDVQSNFDERNIPIEQVGVRNIRFPITVLSEQGLLPSVAQFNLNVALPAEKKGTHMSRFMALLQDHKDPISAKNIELMIRKMLPLLEASKE